MALTSPSRRKRRRPGPPRPEDFTSPVHDERVVARVGSWLGVCLVICFATGLISHYQQHPVTWLPFGPNPVWGYRFTQGTHVVSGTLMLPLLLAKLFSAYPRLFVFPPVRGLVNALDRLSVGVLIAATAFQIATGLLDTAQWYAWHFGFVPTHFAVAWVAVGALSIHVGMKLPVIQRAFARSLADQGDPWTSAEARARADRADSEPGSKITSTSGSTSGDEGPMVFGPDPAGRTRRAFLVGVGVVAAGAALLTAGETIYPLRRLAFLAPRRPDAGPDHLPINKTAKEAAVTSTAADPGWTLKLSGPGGDRELTRAQLTAMTPAQHELPIACVEGWSANAHWSGVPIRDLVTLAGGGPGSSVEVASLEKGGSYNRSTLSAAYAKDPRTLLALRLNGADLTLDHGYPARIIAPDRPGVLQTKWVAELTVGRDGAA